MVVMQFDDWLALNDKSDEIYASRRYIDTSAQSEVTKDIVSRKRNYTKTCVVCGQPKSQNGDICRECRTKQDQVIIDTEKLNQLLHADSRSIHAIGKLGGIAKTTIYQLSCGHMTTCRYKKAARLAEILGVDVFSFCTRTKEEPDVSH